jgi:ATP-binding cassette subfamily B protein
MPLVTRYLVDKVIPTKDFKTLNLLCLAFLLVILARQFSGYLMRVLISKYKTKVHFDIERDLYLHIQQLPLNFFTSKPSGYVLSMIYEVSSAEALMADKFLSIIKDLLTLLVGAQ